MQRFVATVGILGLSGVTLAGCSLFAIPVGSGAGSPALTRFDSCDALADRLTDQFVETLIDARFGGRVARDFPGHGKTARGAPTLDTASQEADGVQQAPSAGADVGGETGTFSETNVQERGVDEPDLVETDGTTLYVVRPEEHTLEILNAWPPEDLDPVARLPIEGTPQSMFLAGDTAVVFSRLEGGPAPRPLRSASDRLQRGLRDVPERRGEQLRITLVDVSQPQTPNVVREVDIDGTLLDARRIGDEVYVVSTMPVEIPQKLWDLADDPSLRNSGPRGSVDERFARNQARAELRQKVSSLVAEQGLENTLPHVWDRATTTRDATRDLGRPLVGCADLYGSPSLSGALSVVSVAHIPLAPRGRAGDRTIDGTGILASGSTVYASGDGLYIAEPRAYGSGIPAQTSIHRFDLTGGKATYDASGLVDGTLLNSYAMSEFDGYLRVATTDSPELGTVGIEDVALDIPIRDPAPAARAAPEPDPRFGRSRVTPSREPANNLFVLGSRAGTLEVVGSLRGIAPGERIKAARFLGDKAFLVTFRQTDPLFAVDLAEPTQPEVVGKLEVPGFSTYLHPLDADFLLAVGVAGNAQGATGGVAVSLFDVSDLAHPRRVDQVTVGTGSSSEALGDPHAFLYYGGVLAIPVNTGRGSELWVLGVDTGRGLWELGRIDHSDLRGGATEIRRAIGIENELYSISDVGVKVSDLYSPAVQIKGVTYGRPQRQPRPQRR